MKRAARGSLAENTGRKNDAKNRHLYSAGRPSRWALAHVPVHHTVVAQEKEKIT